MGKKCRESGYEGREVAQLRGKGRKNRICNKAGKTEKEGGNLRKKHGKCLKNLKRET